ncbi:MAG: aminotransferase class I/II-fold pyridoxal phosphate-dependent enzyme [Pirellulales bacterium]|nr:aminotransferase class I/II-fold pyridoxal phosphate-dependent enzyme [Pirellulales bacterium]
MPSPWLARRTLEFDSSGIRKVFDLAAKMADPINLSIGQPDFLVPDSIKDAAIQAIQQDKNCYSVTQGIPQLLETLQERVDAKYGHANRRVLITSGTSGALVLAMLGMVDPGDEVICFDPYFVAYPALVKMVGGILVPIDTYPDFRIDVDRVAAAITPRTKMIVLNSPCNPTGGVTGKEEVRALAGLAAEHDIALISDEIYREYCYDAPLASPATWNDQTIIVDGFSKTYGVTGWRVGWIHGPLAIIEKLAMLQQYTYVCAPHPMQWAALAALKTDMSAHTADYGTRRDMIVAGLREAGYEVAPSGGAFYVFPKVPPGYASSTEFVTQAIAANLLIIPGNVFSARDTHFRISYAASTETIARGLDVLKKLHP